jgi:hypothetical protein
MAFSTVEKYCYAIEELLGDHFKPRTRNLKNARKSLLLILLTAQIPEDLQKILDKGEIRGLKTRVRRLLRYLRKHSNVPEAFCARYKYRMSEHRVRRRYDISGRTWNYMHRLASETDFNPEYQLPLIDFKQFKWHEKLEEDLVFMDVVLDDKALNDMLVAIYEGYLAPRKKRRKGCEVYGLNMGMIRSTEVQAKRKGITIHKYVSVLRSAPQISADAARWWVEPNKKAIQAVIKANNTLFPQNQILGDFHSHPYDSWQDLLYNEGWDYSRGDQVDNFKLSRSFAELGNPISIAFIVAIARSKHKIKRRHFRGKKNMIQMRVGGCCAIVAVYRSLERGLYSDKQIQLMLPGMVL